MNKYPLVSVIVPTYNEENNIYECLDSVSSQSYKNIEIIVVDSIRTNDGTSEIAIKFTNKVHRFGKERNAQRNFGAKKSKGQYLLFLDADMRLTRNVVKDALNVFNENNKTKAIIIPEKSIGVSYWAKCKALERDCYIGDKNIEAARFFDKTVFWKVGGYNNKMISGEDWDLSRRVEKSGANIGRVGSYILHNEGDLTLLKDLKKKYYYAKKSRSFVDNNIKSVGDVVLFILRPSIFKNWKKLLHDPFHAIGMFIMKILEYIIGVIGIGLSRLR